MNNNIENNRRIAKNTIMLYFRMFITLIVGLFTSRVILDALGIEDYGIYNLVGGFVAMFNILRSGLVSATQRFITYDLGRGDLKELNRTFSTCVIIYVFISIIIVILAEAIGPWFIKNKLVIPESRNSAAIWTFQLSLVMMVFSLISFPYNSLIISHEKMSTFAYISVYEVVAKLVLTYLLYVSPYDKLIVYSILMCIVQITVPIMYMVYCRRYFEESKVHWIIYWGKIKEIYAFTGWAMLGGFASVGLTQGLNVILGMFFNPVVNAARGVAVQVQGIVNSFVSNFQMAVDPQIVKSYARGDNEYMQKLVFSSSKYSYYLLFILSLPLMYVAEQLLALWLVAVPEDSALFLRLIMITTMYDAISNPFAKAIQATGHIRNYQIIFSTLLILIVPVSYILLKHGAEAYIVFVVHIVLGFFAMWSRIIIAAWTTTISLRAFLKEVLLPICIVSLVSILLSYLCWYFMPSGIISVFAISGITVLITAVSIFFLGIGTSERSMVINKLKNIRTL